TRRGSSRPNRVQPCAGLWHLAGCSSRAALLSAPVDDEAAIELAYGRHTRMPHHQRQLTGEEVQNLVHTGLTEGRKPPDVGPADANAFGPEGKGLEDVGTAPNPAVDEHRHLALYRVHDFRETFDRGASTLLRAPPVVR